MERKWKSENAYIQSGRRVPQHHGSCSSITLLMAGLKDHLSWVSIEYLLGFQGTPGYRIFPIEYFRFPRVGYTFQAIHDHQMFLIVFWVKNDLHIRFGRSPACRFYFPSKIRNSKNKEFLSWAHISIIRTCLNIKLKVSSTRRHSNKQYKFSYYSF